MNINNINSLITDLQALADELSDPIEIGDPRTFERGLEQKINLTPEMKRYLISLKQSELEKSYKQACFNAVDYYLHHKYGFDFGKQKINSNLFQVAPIQ